MIAHKLSFIGLKEDYLNKYLNVAVVMKTESYCIIENMIIKKNIDLIITIFIVILLSFMDIELAMVVGCISFSVILIRRTISFLNKGHARGYEILKNGKTLSIPKRVEIFELVDATSPDKLYKYVNIFRSMVIPPRILVIRFQESFEISNRSVVLLDVIEKVLSEEKIGILFSEVDDDRKHQLIKMDLMKNVADSNIFKNIDDALTYAKKILKIN
jgi:MFS superfamily sulfate permease-like transporter